jgi:hypothetical protein
MKYLRALQGFGYGRHETIDIEEIAQDAIPPMFDTELRGVWHGVSRSIKTLRAKRDKNPTP